MTPIDQNPAWLLVAFLIGFAVAYLIKEMRKR